MRNRLIYAALGIVGVLLIGLAIASATVWRADSVLRASATADQAIVVTDPGVLEMAGDPVTVTATVPTGDRVVLAIGRDTDVDGWVGTADHQRVAGLSGWRTLALAAPATPTATATPATTATATASATGAATPTDQPSPTTSGAAAPAGTTAAGSVPDATASDMWVATAHGTGSASLTWQAQPGRWSLLVVGSTVAGAGAPPTLSLEWPRSVTTPYLVPGVVVGGLLVLVALLLFWRDLRRRHEAAWTPVATGAIPVVTAGEGAMTRRQLREMAELARTGQLPTIAPPPVPTASVPVTAPPAAGPTPRVPGPVGASAASGVGTTAAHGEPAAPAEAPEPFGAATTASGRGSGRGVTPTGVHGAVRGGDASSAAAGTGPASRPATPTTGAGDAARPAEGVETTPTASGGEAVPPSEGVETPPAGAGARKGRWRRAAEPVRQQAAEPSSAEASSSSWAPQEGSTATAPAPAVASPARPPAPGGRRARRQAAEAAAAAAGAEAAPGSAEPTPSGADGGAPSAPERAAAAAAAPTTPGKPRTPDTLHIADTATGHPAPSRPAWMPAPLPGAGSTPAAPAPSSPHGPGAQPAWLSRVAARWEQEDAAAEAEEAAASREPGRPQPPPPSSSTPVPSTPAPSPGETSEPQAGRTAPHGDPQQPVEASRADAWRRAWGLPPLETEEEDR